MAQPQQWTAPRPQQLRAFSSRVVTSRPINLPDASTTDRFKAKLSAILQHILAFPYTYSLSHHTCPICESPGGALNYMQNICKGFVRFLVWRPVTERQQSVQRVTTAILFRHPLPSLCVCAPSICLLIRLMTPKTQPMMACHCITMTYIFDHEFGGDSHLNSHSSWTPSRWLMMGHHVYTLYSTNIHIWYTLYIYHMIIA